MERPEHGERHDKYPDVGAAAEGVNERRSSSRQRKQESAAKQ